MLALETKGLKFTLKEEQKTAVKQLFKGRDLVVAGFTEWFWKIPIDSLTGPKREKPPALSTTRFYK